MEETTQNEGELLDATVEEFVTVLTLEQQRRQEALYAARSVLVGSTRTEATGGFLAAIQGDGSGTSQEASFSKEGKHARDAIAVAEWLINGAPKREATRRIGGVIVSAEMPQEVRDILDLLAHECTEGCAGAETAENEPTTAPTDIVDFDTDRPRLED